MLPIAEKISPELGKVWRTMAPAGLLENLALDIPLQATEKTRFQADGKTFPGNSGNCCQALRTFPVRYPVALKMGV
jgi:hypothetical protein